MNMEKEKESIRPIRYIFVTYKPKCKFIWIRKTNENYQVSTSLLRCLLGITSPSLSNLFKQDCLEAAYEPSGKFNPFHIVKRYYFAIDDYKFYKR